MGMVFNDESNLITVIFGRTFEKDSISLIKLIEHLVNRSNSVVIQLLASPIFAHPIHYSYNILTNG